MLSTVRNQLRVLEQDGIILTQRKKYGKLHFLSSDMKENWPKLEEILKKTKKKK